MGAVGFRCGGLWTGECGRSKGQKVKKSMRELSSCLLARLIAETRTVNSGCGWGERERASATAPGLAVAGGSPPSSPRWDVPRLCSSNSFQVQPSITTQFFFLAASHKLRNQTTPTPQCHSCTAATWPVCRRIPCRNRQLTARPMASLAFSSECSDAFAR
jgi:hypothetical protein